MNVDVCIISAGRPQNVAATFERLEGIVPIWFVPEGQGADYEYAIDGVGAPCAVIEVPSTQDTHQRNAALDWADRRGQWCVQIDDDLKRLRLTTPGPASDRFTIGMQDAIDSIVFETLFHDAYLGGLSITDNAGFALHRIRTDKFVRSAFMVVRPGSGLRFDDQFRLKGDYDYTLQHLQKFGKAIRMDCILPTFDFGQGSGGCVDYRTDEVEQDAIERLLQKWPGNIRRRADKPNEVRLDWPGVQAAQGFGL